MPTHEEILNALKAVYDPEIGINIVDLGLVYGTHIEDHKVRIDMTLTSPMCPLGPIIRTQAEAILTSQFEDIEEVEINFVWDPPWDPHTMASEEAKLELGIW
ncbi:MAG TPA: metal-sulfur cluster assembly factor [Chloroflexota bacterium]|nr:metal-sulfur cluster assembly factor [Chloroflexota bacterium]